MVSPRNMQSLKALRERLYHWFIEPVGSVNPDLRHQLNALIVLILVMLTLTVFIPFPFFAFGVVELTRTYVTAIGALAICGCYLVARFGSYYGASWGIFGIVSVLIFALSVSQENPDNLDTLFYLIVPIVTSGILFSKVTMIIVTMVYMVSITFIPLIFAHITFTDVLIGPLSSLAITAVLLIVVQYVYDYKIRKETSGSDQHDQTLRQFAAGFPSLFLIQQQGKIAYINSAGVQEIGAKASHQIVNRPLKEFVAPDERMDKNVRLVLSEAQELPFIVHRKLAFNTLEGEVVDLDVHMQSVLFGGVVATQICAVTSKQSASQYDVLNMAERFAETTDDYVLVYDEAGRVLYMNASAKQSTMRLEHKRHQINVLDVLPRLYNEVESRQNGNTASAMMLEWHTGNSETHFVHIGTHLQDHSGIYLLIAQPVPNDVIMLRKSESDLVKLFESNSIALVLLAKSDGRIIRSNENFCNLTGFMPDQLFGRSLADLGLWDRESFERLFARLQERLYVDEVEIALRTRHGDVRDVMISMEMIEVNSLPSVMVILEDVTAKTLTMSILAERESRYRTVSELMSDYAYGWTVDNGELRLEWITGAFERITGYTVEEALGWNVWGMLHPEDKLSHDWLIQMILKGNIETLDYRLLTKSGKLRWVRDYSRPIWNAERKRVIGIYGAVQDITAQYEAENSLRVHALEQAIVAEIGQKALANAVTYDLLLDEALPLITQVLDVQYCIVLELDQRGDYLLPRSSIGWSVEPSDEIYLKSHSLSQFSFTLLSREPVVLEDARTEVRFSQHSMFENTDVMSGLTVLIHGQTDVLGVLGVFSRNPHEFSLDDINFLQSIANTLSAFVEQQRISEAETSQRILAEALRDTAAVLNSTLDLDGVIDRVLTHVAKVVPHDAASIMLIDQHFAKIIKYQGFGEFSYTTNDEQSGLSEMTTSDLPIVEHMIATRQPLAISRVRGDPRWRYLYEETSWIESYVGAPIFFQGELIGILNVDSSVPGYFTDDDAQRLMAFANQASIAIHNARYAAELQQRVEERTAELNLEHRRLQAILDATADGIFYTQDLEIRYVNQTLCHLLGYSADELVGKSTSVLIGNILNTKDTTRWEEVRQSLARGGVIRDEIQIHRKDGSTFDAALTISMAGEGLDLDGSITTVTLVRDISQQKALDKQRDRFISSASHELRSPITSINTRLYLMRRKPEEMEHHMVLMERIVERMNILVEDLLDRIRIEQGVIQLRRRNFVLQNLVEKIVEIMRDDAALQGLNFETAYVDQPMRVFADPDRIYQVIANLISNAINYTHEGGFIHVRVLKEVDETGQIVAVIQVSDTGVGIPPDDLPHIFDAFYRANKHVKGTGLGLNIARELIRMHDGEIKVESTLGEGSTFSIILPYTDDGSFL